VLIDAHQHFWRLADRAGQWPPPSLAEIHRDFLPEDLAPLLASSAVAGTVLVQSLPTRADTDFLLALAERHPFVLGVVGWVDLAADDAPAQIAELARNPRLKGLRPMLQDLPDDAWIDDPALDPAIEAMVEHGLTFDALVMPRHLPALGRFAARHPRLPVVIDHAAKPLIARGLIEPWLSHLNALAGLRHVHCKLSGLPTEAGPRALVEGGPAAEGEVTEVPSDDRYVPYVDAVLTLFGPRRVLWGSDWPVLNLAGSYGAWLGTCQRLCRRLSLGPDAIRGVFGENARAFYRLSAPHPLPPPDPPPER
jgi:L-fuconolactonase